MRAAGQDVANRKRPWYVRYVTVLAVFILITTNAIFSLEYPAAGAKELVKFAPAVYSTAHRQYLSKRCAWLLRELVIGDGFTRLEQGEIAWAANHALEEFEMVDKAIRLGSPKDDKYKIKDGANLFSTKHNAIMYEVRDQSRGAGRGRRRG